LPGCGVSLAMMHDVGFLAKDGAVPIGCGGGRPCWGAVWSAMHYNPGAPHSRAAFLVFSLMPHGVRRSKDRGFQHHRGTSIYFVIHPWGYGTPRVSSRRTAIYRGDKRNKTDYIFCGKHVVCCEVPVGIGDSNGGHCGRVSPCFSNDSKCLWRYGFSMGLHGMRTQWPYEHLRLIRHHEKTCLSNFSKV